jgi:hypothetical protein
VSDIRIKIGAALDSSAQTVLDPLKKTADRARDAISKAIKQGTSGFGPFRSSAKAAGDETAKIGAAAKRSGETLQQSLGKAASRFQDLSRGAKQLPPALSAIAREAERELKRVETAAARAALGLASVGGGGQRRSRFWFAAGGNLAIKKPHLETLDMDPVRGLARVGMAGFGAMWRGTREILSGAGVHSDLGSMVSTAVLNQSLATKLSNSGYMPGMAGPNGRLVGAGDLLSQATQTGNETGQSTTDTLSAMRAFVGKTGDLALARDSIKDMSILSRATGTSLEDMANASAEVANHLGDIPDKANVVNAVMRQIAGQGKLGAVEIKDLASQMAKIASVSSFFEGGAANNIAILGMIAQESKLRGGAASGSQAATSVQRFATGLQNKTTLKHWTAGFGGIGANPFTDATHSTLRDPREIIMQALQMSSHGGMGQFAEGKFGKMQGRADLSRLSQLFPNAMGMRAVTGFASIYNEAGGGHAGLKAVNDEFERLKAAQLDQQEVMRAFGASMETSEAKVAIFNNKMNQLGADLAAQALPALEQLGPSIMQIAGTALPAFGAALIAMAPLMKDFADFLAKVTGVDKETQAKAQQASESGALNTIGQMRLFRESQLEQGGGVLSGDIVGMNMQRAKPVLDKEAKEEEGLHAAIRAANARFKGDEEAFAGYGISQIRSIAKSGGVGSESANQYLQDAQTLTRLHDTLSKLQTERENLTTLLSSGTVSVRISNLDELPKGGGTGSADGSPRPGAQAPAESPIGP